MYHRWILFYKGFHAKIPNGDQKIKGYIINHVQKLCTFQIFRIHFPFYYIFISTVWIISFETLVALLYWLKRANNSSEIAFLSLSFCTLHLYMHIDHIYDAFQSFSECPLRTVSIYGTTSKNSVNLLNFALGLICFPSFTSSVLFPEWMYVHIESLHV